MDDQEFGNVGIVIKWRIEELKTLDRLEEGRGLVDEDKERRRMIIGELEISLLQEEIS